MTLDTPQAPQATSAAAQAQPTSTSSAVARAPRNIRKKVRLGTIHADEVDLAGCLNAIEAAIDTGKGGFVVTPNVDHVCLAEQNITLRKAYEDATLSLVDGTPLLWLARAMGHPLPEKISGSDLIRPLMQRCANKRLRVYFLGGMPGVGALAAEKLSDSFKGLNVVGTDAPDFGFEADAAKNKAVLDKISAAKPHLILVALGAPKQEVWMHQHRHALAPSVAIGVGASLDFVAGIVKRAPGWMSQAGLEWVYRLAQEPKRMASRYLVRDRAIVKIAWRMLRLPSAQRAFFA